MKDEEEQPLLQKKRSGSYFAQLMVLFNGLILTITAYVTLSVFMTGAAREDYRRMLEDTRQSITKTIVDMGQSVRATATILALSPNKDEETLRRRIVYAVPNLKNFDHIFWLEKDEAGSWKTHDIVSVHRGWRYENILSPVLTRNLYDYITVSGLERGSDFIVTSDLPQAEYEAENYEPLLKGRPFMMAKYASESVIVVGIGRIGSVLGKEWLESRTGIHNLAITDIGSNSSRRIFYMGRGNGGKAEKPDLSFTNPPIDFKIGNAMWRIQIESGNDLRTILIENTPFLVLLFGLTLTLIGTMYVRNNQKQSFRLTLMNSALAQKNYDLNMEVLERERLNRNLRQAEGEYRAVVDSVSDIIFETLTDGTIVFLNSTWKKITGFDPEQSLNRKLFDMVHPQEQAEQMRNFEQMVKGHKHAYRAYTRIRTSEGIFRAVELAVSMMRQDENKVMRVVGTITDVEERRRAEKALTEAEKKYRTIVENAAGGIYQVTPDGQFLSANPAMARILEYETTDHMLRDIRNANDSLYASQSERSRFIRELELMGYIKNFEAQVITHGGRRIWVNENARAVRDDEGNILYFEGSMEDITKRKETEIKLRDAKIESDLSSRAKSEFLANMSHELRTPLNAIIGFSELIRNEVLGRMENRQYWEYARDIYDSGRKLLDIINEILDVSRIEAGERQLSESVIDIHGLTQECLDFVQPKIEAGNLSVVNLIGKSMPRVQGEELALKQILLNLLSNAIKFTPAGGRITLSQELDPDGQLRLSVTDTGIGLDEAEIEKALSPFGQVETVFSRSGSGVGLGLTLVDSLIKLHGGRLELFSQKGIGTTAAIMIPRKRVIIEHDMHKDSSVFDRDEQSPTVPRSIQ